jgi:cell division protein ZapA
MGGDRTKKSVVTVVIAGEEYTIRADATPEYTIKCAEYVDRTISQIERQGGLVEAHKAAILAALALTDQLFQAQAETEALRGELARRSAELADDIEAQVTAEDLASRS